MEWQAHVFVLPNSAHINFKQNCFSDRREISLDGYFVLNLKQHFLLDLTSLPSPPSTSLKEKKLFLPVAFKERNSYGQEEKDKMAKGVCSSSKSPIERIEGKLMYDSPGKKKERRYFILDFCFHPYPPKILALILIEVETCMYSLRKRWCWCVIHQIYISLTYLIVCEREEGCLTREKDCLLFHPLCRREERNWEKRYKENGQTILYLHRITSHVLIILFPSCFFLYHYCFSGVMRVFRFAILPQ